MGSHEDHQIKVVSPLKESIKKRNREDRQDLEELGSDTVRSWRSVRFKDECGLYGLAIEPDVMFVPFVTVRPLSRLYAEYCEKRPPGIVFEVPGIASLAARNVV